MKNTEENILKQQALDKKQGVDRNSKSGKSTQTKPKVSSGMFPFPSTYHTSFLVCVLIVSYYLNVIIIGAKGKKRKNDSSTEVTILYYIIYLVKQSYLISVWVDCVTQKENASVENLINIQIPSALKKQLVDDWEFVNEQDKVGVFTYSL